MKTVSKSKRTTIEVHMDDLGAAVVTILRDGRMMNRFDVFRESETSYPPKEGTVR